MAVPGHGVGVAVGAVAVETASAMNEVVPGVASTAEVAPAAREAAELEKETAVPTDTARLVLSTTTTTTTTRAPYYTANPVLLDSVVAEVQPASGHPDSSLSVQHQDPEN